VVELQIYRTSIVTDVFPFKVKKLGGIYEKHLQFQEAKNTELPID